jgi:hypothetical protein
MGLRLRSHQLRTEVAASLAAIEEYVRSMA